MITPLLHTALEPVIDRHRQLRRLRWLVLSLAGLTVLVSMAVGLRHPLPAPLLLIPLLLVVLWGVAALLAGRWKPDLSEIARRIEVQHPELHALLQTAVEQQPRKGTRRLTFLQQRVVQTAIEESRRSNWLDTVPGWKIGLLRLLTLVFVAMLALLCWDTAAPTAWEKKIAHAVTGVTVTPGDASIERGSGLVVLVDFHQHPPNDATLIIQAKNQPEQRMPLVRNLDDPVFGGGLTEVDSDLTYKIVYAGEVTKEFSVKVFEHPRLDRADATLHFPEYTKLPEKKVPDTHRVSGVEGSKLDVAFQLNKPVKSATLVAKDGSTVPLTVSADQPTAQLRDFPVKASETYELKLEDADGRANKLPAQFIVEALPNRRPELKVATPKGDTRVSPIEEVAFRAQVWDDFGLTRYGLSYTIAGGAAKDVSLGQETKPDEKQQLAHLLKLEDIGAKPDELISWYLWAEDTGPDGQPRQSVTDIYFAEVRPFEEIFRKNEQESGEGGGNSNEATKLAELQKQIVTATWNLQRGLDPKADPAKPGAKYLQDEPVVRDSQGEAIKLGQKLMEKLEDPKQRALAEEALRPMKTSLDQLTAASSTTLPLQTALAAEQSAYNALLKLAAHEYRVSKSKNAKGQSNAKQQQQLEELEMQDEKKRYETKKEAEPAGNEQQREQLAILNRLKELAQRQHDINERLKELQTALQAAQTEKEKEEVRRQLKRLHEEEQQLLTDLDETRQKMEQSSQQAEMASDRQQLDQTRNEAQKTAESMEKGETSQALASGTRTQQELQQMRDDFRKKTSGQFSEQMRQMRTDARELAEHQQEIADKLKPEAGQPQRRTLDGNSEREQLARQFEKQQADLEQITQKMKEVSEQAETAEPLLAKELYDSLRKTTQAGTAGTLKDTQELAQLGNLPQAQKFEEKARKEIEDLKNGVEKAAESVLGDETEAIRQARAELDLLRDQIDREIARNRPDLAAANQDKSRGGQSPNGESGQQQPGAKDGQSPANGSEQKPGQGQESATGGGKSAQAAKPGQQSSSQPSGQQPGEQSGGQQPGQQAGNQPGGQKPGEQAGTQPGGKQPGQQAGNTPGGQQPDGQSGQPGQQPGQNPSGQTASSSSPSGQPGAQPGQGAKPGQGQSPSPGKSGATASSTPGGADSQSGSNQPGKAGNQSRLSSLSGSGQRSGTRIAGAAGGGEGGGGGGNFDGGPLTGENYSAWSDRLRDVEEMIDDPNLRTEAARIRETAKGVRSDFKRNSTQPDWDTVQTKIRGPLAELRNRLTEELARRESKENLVPIDRDPVPVKYAERVRRYYEELGRSR